MKFTERKKYFTRCLAACFAVLVFCLAGCSSDGKDSVPDAGSSGSSSAEAPSDISAPTKDFEQDAYTTEFVIDRTLAEAVRVSLGLPGDMPLTKDFAATVTELFLWDGVRIETITGISNFTSLERLEISESDCTEIGELAAMPSLQSIGVSWSYVVGIPDFSACPDLTELRLTAGCITDLTPLCRATSLRFVDLSHNDITSVAPLKDVTFLDSLCLEGNGITDYAAIKDSAALCRALDNGGQSPVSFALEAEERAKRIVLEQTDASMTDEIKLERLYTYLIDNVTFDDSPHQSRPFGYRAMFTGKGVCGDYAEALCLLARHAGITCTVVSTDTHAFNAAKLDGAWYLFDALWDDAAEGTPTNPLTWDYFGFTTETALSLPDHAYDTKRYPVSKQALQRATG